MMKMMQGNYNAGIIGSSSPHSPFDKPSKIARLAGPMMEYRFENTAPKKKLKELRKVLLPEKRRFLLFKFGYKYNIRNRCLVCGSWHEWDASDPLRAGIILSEVTKGRPLQGTYCPRHANMYKQFEMLQDEVLADKHGLEFKRYIPKPRIPLMSQGPMTNLNQAQVSSLIAAGWLIEPPKGTKEIPKEQYIRLMSEIQGKLKQIENLVGVIDNGEE